jgi:hypothetical protein
MERVPINKGFNQLAAVQLVVVVSVVHLEVVEQTVQTSWTCLSERPYVPECACETGYIHAHALSPKIVFLVQVCLHTRMNVRI